MSLFDVRESLKVEARKLPQKYELYSIDDLANAYCDALDSKDTVNQGIYYSALILRFWYTIDRMYNKCKSIPSVERETCYDKLLELINVACYYRAWRDPSKKTNAQACIVQTISTRGAPAIIGDFNYQKKKHTSLSLDDRISDDGDSTFSDALEDESAEIFDGAKDIVQSLIRNNYIIEAIIADTMAYKNVFKYEKKNKRTQLSDGTVYKYVESSSELWPFRLVQELNKIDDKYIKYFSSKYKIKPDALNSAISDLSKANNQKKYRMIKNSRETMKSFIG